MSAATLWYKSPLDDVNPDPKSKIRSIGDLDVRGAARKLWAEIRERSRIGQRWRDIVDKEWAKILGCSVSTFYRAVAMLKRVGWLATALKNGRRIMRFAILLAGEEASEPARQAAQPSPKVDEPERPSKSTPSAPRSQKSETGNYARFLIGYANEEGVTLSLDEGGRVCAIANRPGAELSNATWGLVRRFGQMIADEIRRALPKKE